MMKHCMECGTLLETRELESEGMIPYCPACKQFRFPVFNTAVSMIVVDEAQKKILLIEQYGRTGHILVAGYVTRGENAETTCRRELMEETGLEADAIRFNRSEFFKPSNTLMLNFTVRVKPGQSVHTTDEVDSWQWFTYDEAREHIRPNSLARRFLLSWMDDDGAPMP